MEKIIEFLRKNGLVIMTLTVSICTLAIYVRQTNLLSKQTEALISQNEAAAWPRIILGSNIVSNPNPTSDNDVIKEFTIIIANVGNGPAIIERIVVRIDGIEVENWKELFQHKNIEYGSHNGETIFGSVRSAGIYTTWYTALIPEQATAFHHASENMEIEICYSSVFGDFWTVTKKGFRLDRKNILPVYEGPHKEYLLKAEKYFNE
ncbi:MAG: hypothetical protein LBV43_14870 [Prevotella sp.]|jgi:hypothetical protein|nr:hypothetical protein [Prevotella sp.]